MLKRKIKRLLIANRGEIAIRICRACTELGIRTVAIYSKEDISSYHRYKADESYLVGKGKNPIEAYLDIDSIIEVAKTHHVDAIHPGYGFLSENAEFARRCEEEGIIFVGPRPEHLTTFGDKAAAREAALNANIPVIPGSGGPVSSVEDVKNFGEKHGYPIIIKAVLGGGGRGMRIVRSAQGVEEAYARATSEAKQTFGKEDVYVEKYLDHPRHIEVQIMADQSGEIVHLYERDCSVQRRHQKVVEVAPSRGLGEKLRHEICEAAVRLMKSVNYLNAGTVEFLVTPNGQFYFIEVNPRVQVEHTITELITGIDIVSSQILIAEGYGLHEDPVLIPEQKEIHTYGYAIQCRVTTEDPSNQFMPDTGKIVAYRSGGGFGVRLDAGNAFTGSVITPYYDSLLVKLSTSARSFKSAAVKMLRNLKEFRIRGIKTNIPFLINVVKHPDFLEGNVSTTFIDTTPELFVFEKILDRGTKMLSYIGNVTVNGYPGIAKNKKPIFDVPPIPDVKLSDPYPGGTKQILEEKGPKGVSEWVKAQKKVLLTDTTFRDAHQSLLATRMRTKDIIRVTAQTAHLLPHLFSEEAWGGATFDTAYRFLREDPWERLHKIRAKMPNILLQMLLRGSNAVGYKNYPDNLIKAFVKEAAKHGVDVFRVFDSLNWIEGMRVSLDAVIESGKIAEGTMCYTGDILDGLRTKYTIDYYKKMAKELENAGAHILGIKDMAGLLKPEAAYRLIAELKDTVDIPIHLHTHDTSGNGIYTYVRAIEAGVDIVDVAIEAMAGMTSQPSVNSLYYALSANDRRPDLSIDALESLSHYWEKVRACYFPFESGMKTSNAEIYKLEMPGGQYSNLKQQAIAVGLGDRFEEVKDMYRRVNLLFGDIVKVTPSSKVVGDMTLYMVQNNLNEDSIYEKGQTLDFPDSVVNFFMGELGQPYQGFPRELQRIVLKGKKPLTDRPGKNLEPINFDDIQARLEEKFERKFKFHEVLSAALYPKVYTDYLHFCDTFGENTVLSTPTFFYGLRLGEEVSVTIEEGKMLVVKLISIGHPQKDGTRTLYYELNGQPREVSVKDVNVQSSETAHEKAEKDNPHQIGASMPGTVVKVLVSSGERVKKGDHLLVTEAMKMETTVQASMDGTVKKIHVNENDVIETGDLMIELS
ncbi:pyruvate carboxylase [Sporolactobacillus terrae]|uniref:Pyruvate carboxylase n=1 Tax=Sporolactobacillus terrae TaxID=269673 RepID=A0A410D840_9BACL|nr:pyruvate carboxylase [Sporolactobacillus terrae]QAA22236.1 pyruvate carboxylase [Sporolactobacillus terrae]QAA25210.1 pyruvate carboxylase [Sporolactobacillus terrae]UAK17028.1 pyruvate carboxylase [Sporolactobacillus terrae]BBN98548.1 pyruvate carboxylase [Sporolactobacillus terrae]